MSSLGFESSGTVIVRCSIAAVLFGITLLIKDRSLFRVHLRDIWLFLGSGLCSMLFFTYCYFQAINLTSLATAAILLYTAPSMVMVMSLFIFREKLTANKVAALVMAFLGCCLVSGLGSGSLALSTKGLIYGLCGGFGYALYSIFATLAMNKGYNSLTINFYTCLFAAIGACIIWGGTGPIVMAFSSVKPAVSSLTMGLVSCYLPYLLYTRGLRDVEAGKASIMASVEPVVAAIMGFAVFHESMSFLGALGILLVLGAVVVLNLNFEKKAKKS
jgi:drug/metabolite transporter (DMT)-like permease